MDGAGVIKKLPDFPQVASPILLLGAISGSINDRKI